MGAIGAIMFGFAVCFGLTYFLLGWLNQRWAQMDGPAQMRLYAPTVYWWFLPLFGAISASCPLAVWLLRRMGRTDEADRVEEQSNAQAGFNTYAVLRLMAWGIAFPIAIVSVLAVPIHMSIDAKQVRVGHFASLRPEIFDLGEARRAVLTETRRVEHHVLATRSNLTLYFADGRRLEANAVADGGESADPEAVRLLLRNTGLTPERVSMQTPADAR